MTWQCVPFKDGWNSLDQQITWHHPPQSGEASFLKPFHLLELLSLVFDPCSLRRGGATWWFGKHHSLDQILVQGRWQAAKTARIYINEGLAILAELQLKQSDSRLNPFLTQFRSHFNFPTFATLSPPVTSTGRSGGRGKGTKSKFSMKKREFDWKYFQKKKDSFIVLRAFFRVRGLACPEKGEHLTLSPLTLGSGPGSGRGKTEVDELIFLVSYFFIYFLTNSLRSRT